MATKQSDAPVFQWTVTLDVLDTRPAGPAKRAERKAAREAGKEPEGGWRNSSGKIQAPRKLELRGSFADVVKRAADVVSGIELSGGIVGYSISRDVDAAPPPAVDLSNPSAAFGL